MEKKISAVEWLENEFQEMCKDFGGVHSDFLVKFEQAKAIDRSQKAEEIKNGDVFDIGQTVNGVSKFLWFNEKWYYFEERMTREYNYDQEELSATVLNESGLEDITYLGNILLTFKSE